MSIPKKRVFIGSSSEELHLAESAKQLLESDFDVIIWNDNMWDSAVFKINQNFLSDLLKASLKFDFGILLGTKDDKVVYRDTEYFKARDNVIFELGLFVGRLGISKCAFLIDKNLDLPSDFSGISLARFESGNVKSFLNAVAGVKALFLNSRDSDINFFPSAILATVYFQSLIEPTCRALINDGGIHFTDGRHFEKWKINVIIPNRINADVNLQFETMKKRYKTEEIEIKSAGRPRNIHIDSQVKGDTIEIIDFPTVISGINHAISHLLPTEFSTMSPDYNLILDRELQKFIFTLKECCLRHGFDSWVHVKPED
ncbi:nucleotide-binding protein [Cytophagaceae bacterium DM2B3-1]|uniref:CD-NTase-associated protein 12 n=1 Tax=Xanthocytophaga flava TaxID=3048013 RepID=A0ABT7CMN5_9BACT|nr:STING domain-containing protein [Xanthocytophaga flavus]MDJ1495018.1 nucleotide-binding protein [Xanthocytophaga flavus]